MISASALAWAWAPTSLKDGLKPINWNKHLPSQVVLAICTYHNNRKGMRTIWVSSVYTELLLAKSNSILIITIWARFHYSCFIGDKTREPRRFIAGLSKHCLSLGSKTLCSMSSRQQGKLLFIYALYFSIPILEHKYSQLVRRNETHRLSCLHTWREISVKGKCSLETSMCVAFWPLIQI